MIFGKYVKKIAALLSVALVAGCVSANLLNAQAEIGYPEEVVLPLTLIDYDADNLLFEYDRDSSIGINFDFTTTEFANSVSGANIVHIDPYVEEWYKYVTGLVEPELVDGIPRYKRTAVEKVAQLIRAQILNPGVNDTSVAFEQLKNKLCQESGQEINYIDITNEKLGQKYFYDYGWEIQRPESEYTKANGEIREKATGALIWKQNGDGITYYGTDFVRDTLVLTLNMPDAAKAYQVRAWNECVSAGDINLQVYRGGLQYTSTNTGFGWQEINCVDAGSNEMILKIVPARAASQSRVSGLSILEGTVSGGDPIQYIDMQDYSFILSTEATYSFTHSGWRSVSGILVERGNALYEGAAMRWGFNADGLASYQTDESVYRILELSAGKQYLVNYRFADKLQIDIYDALDDSVCIASNIRNGELFFVPEASGGTRSVKVVVTGDKNLPYVVDDFMLSNFSLMEVNCELGTYEQSELKFTDKSKGYAEVVTCMDYAYYMLNNLFAYKEDFIRHPNDYQTITLRHAGNGQYEFSADTSDWTPPEKRYKVIYDTGNRNIKNDINVLDDGDGFFPLDAASTNENKYMSENGNVHNYHYTMCSHAFFYYEENKDLYFEFTGDDDVYLFINGRLALDLGGAHLAANKRIHLNAMKSELGLESGGIYRFDFFYMERHTTASNFYVNTNIRLLEMGELDLEFYRGDCSLPSGSIVDKNTEIELEYCLKSNVGKLTNVQFTDHTLGIEVGVNGFQNPQGTRISEQGIRVTVCRANGSTEENYFAPTASLEIGNYFRGLTLALGERLTVRGIYHNVTQRFDEALEVTFNSPRYAGVYADVITNVFDTTGVIDVNSTFYTVEYYKEGHRFEVVTGLEGKIGERVTDWNREKLPEGYKLDRAEGITLVRDSNQNILRVYFVKDNLENDTTQIPPALPDNGTAGDASMEVLQTQTNAAFTDDMLPWKVSLAVILFGLAGLCFRVSRWGREEGIADKS